MAGKTVHGPSPGASTDRECVRFPTAPDRSPTCKWCNKRNLLRIGKRIAVLQSTSASTDSTLTRLERKIDESVPRREYDTRIAAVETRLAEIGVRLRELDLALARLARQP